MRDHHTLLSALSEGKWDETLGRMYALSGRAEDLEAARTRAMDLVRTFYGTFPDNPGEGACLFSGPGRTEIGGNHTDHQHGHVLCGSVDLDMLACAAPNRSNRIRIVSQGYPPLEVCLDHLEPVPEERNTSQALVRGVAARISQLGYTPVGFDACVTSTVLSGSGLSSSAAYEVLIGDILNTFGCGEALNAVEIAKIGQWAENVHFGKPCGLMDQMGSSVGGAVAIDFQNPADPVVTPVGYDFTRSGHVLCIVDSGSCHADLTDDYAAIPREMGAVAGQFGRRVLREVPEADFKSAIPALRRTCGDRAVLRAYHFYRDDRTAVAETRALMEGNFPEFLRLVNASGLSSSLYLQNTWSVSAPDQQAIPLALALGRELLEDTGAIRVHGGGFAGTIQAFVPNDRLERFRTGMEDLLGKDTCHILHIRPSGGCRITDPE